MAQFRDFTSRCLYGPVEEILIFRLSKKRVEDQNDEVSRDINMNLTFEYGCKLWSSCLGQGGGGHCWFP